MLEQCGVYAIICKPTGELYIGGTRISFRERFKWHKWQLNCPNRGRSSTPLLQAAWSLYGEDAFEFRPLKAFPPAEVSAREQEALERLRPALNCNQKAGPSKNALAQRLRYRRSIGLEGDALHAPPHMNGKRHQVGDEYLTLGEISLRTGLTLPAILHRIRRGATGEALLAPKHRAPRKPYTRR